MNSNSNSNSNSNPHPQVLPAGLRHFRQLVDAVGGSAVVNKEMLAAAPGAWSIHLEVDGAALAALLRLDVGLYELLSYAAALPLVSIS